MILFWLYLFGKYECGTNAKARRLQSELVELDGNITVNGTRLEWRK